MSYTPSLVVIPYRILYLEGVQLSYIKVYEHIFHLWNQRKQCFISNPEFCRRTGLGISTVQEALAFFEEKGELKRTFKGRRRFLIQPELSIEIGQNDSANDEHAPEPADGSHPSQQMVATRDSRPYKDIRFTKLIGTNLKATKGKAVDKIKTENKVKHDFADSMDMMGRESEHIKQNERFKKSKMPDNLKELCKSLSGNKVAQP